MLGSITQSLVELKLDDEANEVPDSRSLNMFCHLLMSAETRKTQQSTKQTCIVT